MLVVRVFEDIRGGAGAPMCAIRMIKRGALAEGTDGGALITLVGNILPVEGDRRAP